MSFAEDSPTSAEYRRRQDIITAARDQREDPYANISTAELEQRAYESLALNPDNDEDLGALQTDACNRFIAVTPDYLQDPYNGRMITKQLEVLGVDGTDPAHIAKAWEILKGEGLVKINQEGAQEYSEEVKRQTRTHQAFLSAKRNLEPPPPQEDPSQLSTDELERRMYQHFDAGGSY